MIPETANKRTTNSNIQVIGDSSNKILQQATTDSSADSSHTQNINGGTSGQLSISSPYIHLSTCYAGKVRL